MVRMIRRYSMKKIFTDGSPKQKTTMKMVPLQRINTITNEESAQTDHCYTIIATSVALC